MSFLAELKRRNVFRVGIAYAITSWLLIQVSDILFESIGAPPWVMLAMFIVLAAGFIIALIFAWAFEMTPEGVKKEKDVDRRQSIAPQTGRKLDNAIIGVLVLALGYFIVDKFVLDPGRDALEVATAVQVAQEQSQPQTAPSTEPSESNNSIAVLPFVNMSDDGANEYFSDGLSEELLNLLAKIPELKVAARTSSFQFKGRTGDIADIAAQLKVANILEGSVRKSGNMVRITVQLIKAENGYHMWSETYDRTLENVFQVQDEIAVAVVAALKITLLGAAPAVAEVNPEAYALFLKGRYFYNQRSEQNSHKAAEAYRAALAIDADYASAWAGLARTLSRQAGFEYIDYESGIEQALAAARRAVDLDPELAMAWVSLSEVQGGNLWDWEAANASSQKAMELEPANSDVLQNTAELKVYLGQFDSGLSYIEKAVDLDPLNLNAISKLAGNYADVGQYENAEKQMRYLLGINPNYATGHSSYAFILLQLGRLEEALAEADKSTEGIWRLMSRSWALFALGRQVEADVELDLLIDHYQDFWAVQIAQTYAFRGEADKAFKWLDAALEYRDPGLANLLAAKEFIKFHHDPRWQIFIEKVGLLDAWKKMPAKYRGPLL